MYLAHSRLTFSHAHEHGESIHVQSGEQDMNAFVFNLSYLKSAPMK